MTFALFLGAGNMIFPPYLGQVAGPDLVVAILGFLLTGVGLPLLGVIATARLGGGLSSFTRDLPSWVAMVVGLVLYLSIGPLFAAPRTGIVAWEMSFAGAFPDAEYGQMIYSIAFFGVTLLLCLFPGRLIDNIGKIITPMLVLVLLAIAAGVFLFPLGELGTVTGIKDSAFSWGFQQGYQTMDTLASLAFGIVIITALRQRGVTDKNEMTRYTITAGVIAAVGLAAVYLTLAYLGATSHSVIPGAENGADILTAYIEGLYGSWGTVLLGISITLACLTTSVGLMTACGEYFSEVLPMLGYRGWVILCTLVSALIANVGLTQLLEVTIPALLIIYPFAIALILLALVRGFLKSPIKTYMMTLLPVFVVGLVDGLAASGVTWAAGISEGVLSWLPLHADSLGWLAPGLAGFMLSLAGGSKENLAEA
ncbi:branched-chain amino acid transport system II carrier protein [Parendozoicomonas haliclonae]|uniref:Branched-chain amino acid transport system carrier protein n=2 Tax=Parendozoicomonas haliclonae TaxID=1960125 RepID=A0A1X7AJF1_9GAMM|nr:Branched-chain amino acid transport system 2 carrier protein [Parendozoicomonas haliclonae]